MPTITTLPITGSPPSFEPAGLPIRHGAHHEATHTHDLMPGNPKAPNPFSLRRKSSTVVQIANAFTRNASQNIDGNIRALLALSGTLAKDVPEDFGECSYLIGVKATVNGDERITLCSDRVLEEDPHSERLAELESGQLSRQDKKKILSDILESRQDRKDSAANLHLQKLIDTIENDPSLATEEIPDKTREALLAVRLEDIEATYKPEAGSEAHQLILNARKTLRDAPDTFHDEEVVEDMLAEIVESIGDSGTELAKQEVKRLLTAVSRSVALPAGCSAYEVIKKVVTSEKELLVHLDIQIFQKLVEQVKKDLPGQAKGSDSFDALLAKRKVPSRESSISGKSLIAMSLSREASHDDIPEGGGLPPPLRQCSNDFVGLYFGNVNALIKLCDSDADKEEEKSGISVSHRGRATATENAEMKEAIEILTQYRSHELTTRFKDNLPGLVEHQMALPKESGEYRAAARALAEIARLSKDNYRSEYEDRPRLLRAEREKLASSVTDSGSFSHEEAVNNAVVALKREIMDEVLASLDEQRAARIAQRSNSLYMKFLGVEELVAHKAKLIENDPVFKDTEECAAIDKTIEMFKLA